jgi:hypothetical protein
VLPLPQGRAACRKLQAKLLADMKVDPDSKDQANMLSRVKDNLGERERITQSRLCVWLFCALLLTCVSSVCLCVGWYARKAPQNARGEECPADVRHLCGKDKKHAVATVSEL